MYISFSFLPLYRQLDDLSSLTHQVQVQVNRPHSALMLLLFSSLHSSVFDGNETKQSMLFWGEERWPADDDCHPCSIQWSGSTGWLQFNSTQLSRELRTQVSNTSKSASIWSNSHKRTWHLLIGTRHTAPLIPRREVLSPPGLSKICRNAGTEARTAVKRNGVTSCMHLITAGRQNS